MMKKWCFFGASAILGGFALLSHGAPFLPVAIGIGLGALMTARKAHSS
jgi:hypothetical protein